MHGVPAADFDMLLTFKSLMTALRGFADSRCDIMKVAPADSCDTGMPSLYFALLLLPAVAEFTPVD